MACRVWPLIAALVLLGLAGCSNYQKAQRPAWRSQAETACLAQKLIHASAYLQPRAEIDGPGICGLNYPFKVTALLDGDVALNSTSTLGCPMIAELDAWLSDVVQPQALARFGQKVAQLNSMGAYACRSMNNQAGASISEHAFGNAIDIGGFILADGRDISIVRDWTHGDEQTQAFLRDIQAGACTHFTTVLAPGSNAFHYNHIHVDLAMHGNSSAGARRICKPAPQTTIPALPGDGLPEAPSIEEEEDIAQGHAPMPALALQGGPGPGPQASLPPAYTSPNRSQPLDLSRSPSLARDFLPPVQTRTPAHGSLRDDGAFVPEGRPEEWDITSSIGRH
jgi:hypothetical protein